ncbi:MAG: hypothetical protein M0004_13090 [Actinomycetota bacterium]|nr:hypothetical protein [Actinomycetota bacterium]
MFVSDLRHFLDLPDDAPGPARKMADHLSNIVRAATAVPAGASWVSALPCRRRPERRPCPGRMSLCRLDVPARIEWHCTTCDDDGVISGWEGSHFDLRAPGSAAAPPSAVEIPVSDEVLAALRDLLLLDAACERLVYRARASEAGAVLTADEAGLEELVGFVAAEANHEPNRRRQQRLDHAYEVLSDALEAMSPSPPREH